MNLNDDKKKIFVFDLNLVPEEDGLEEISTTVCCFCINLKTVVLNKIFEQNKFVKIT